MNRLFYRISFFFSVAAKSDKNLMTVSNLGVCFGPTLLRPEEETMAAIMEIKFCNVVVEIMIENYDQVKSLLLLLRCNFFNDVSKFCVCFII